ncbi:unnamed protein product [Trifolium pratense]|uniref:Uncharacterized protein n=1 Tax=Trifolium pratense TaxID=57577 RepID=A0ACB0L6N7_TRIPR|nr:unnamed protein product [Trifolium pratense]
MAPKYDNSSEINSEKSHGFDYDGISSINLVIPSLMDLKLKVLQILLISSSMDLKMLILQIILFLLICT